MTAVLDAEPAPVSSWQTIRRGLSLSPELRVGLGGTLALSVVAMVGRVAVPIAVQQVIDRGLRAPGGPDVGVVADHRRRRRRWCSRSPRCART